MTHEEFMEWVRSRRWQQAKSSDHEYTIRYWDRRGIPELIEAARTCRERGEPARWHDGATYRYYRPGDGYRYWECGGPLEDMVGVNRFFEGGGDSEQPALFDPAD